MPRTTRPTTADTGLVPVPVAVFLPDPHRTTSRPTAATVPDPRAGWCALKPADVARLIAVYSRHGDLVIDLDNQPVVASAAGYLDRRPIPAHPDGGGHACGYDGDPVRPGPQARPVPPTHRSAGLRAAGLVLVCLPRPGTDGTDLAGVAAAMRAWRAMLRPGGFLLTVLAPPDRRSGPAAGYRATVIAAARAAGLIWQQELLAVTAPLPEHDPHATPDTDSDAVATVPPVLIGGRHAVVHVTVLAFRHPAGGDHA